MPVVPVGAISESTENKRKAKKDSSEHRDKGDPGAIVPGVRVGHLGGLGQSETEKVGDDQDTLTFHRNRHHHDEDDEDGDSSSSSKYCRPGSKRVGCLKPEDIEDSSKVRRFFIAVNGESTLLFIRNLEGVSPKRFL